MVLWIWLQMQLLLTSEDNYRCEPVAHNILTLWNPGGFGDFQKKQRLNACGFAREYLRSCMGYGPGQSVKRRGKSSSLHSKKIICLGSTGFLWVMS